MRAEWTLTGGKPASIIELLINVLIENYLETQHRLVYTSLEYCWCPPHLDWFFVWSLRDLFEICKSSDNIHFVNLSNRPESWFKLIVSPLLKIKSSLAKLVWPNQFSERLISSPKSRLVTELNNLHQQYCLFSTFTSDRGYPDIRVKFWK